ncbi:partial methionyl-tRNA synthetase, partial [Methylococcales bacterium]
VGTCPVCGNDNAYGDQCEKCGSTLSPEQLKNPRSALSNAIPVKRKTKHWYFPLNKYEDFLNEWIVKGKKDEWTSNVYGQCKSWLDNGLQPRAMTRDSNWGVPVPLPDADGKVLYVWFDAPIGYISATKDLTPMWADYWQKEDTKLVHFIGKDNIVFHCIIFPAMLKAHGSFVLPDNVPANEFLNIEGDKVSTSRNWAVWVHEYLQDFPEHQDVLRYVLCANAPESKDNDFTWKDFQDRNNSELVAIFGNFVNRTFVLMHKLCNGRVPALHQELMDDADHAIIENIKAAKQAVENSIENYKFRDALYEVIDLARSGNKYMQDKQPWIVAKSLEENPDNQKVIDNCLHLCLQLTANMAILANPFMPFTVQKMLHMMKVVDKMLDWENAGRIDLLKVNYPLRAPELLFKKIDDEQMKEQVDKLHNASNAAKAAVAEAEQEAPAHNPVKPEIVYDDFAKIDLRVGTIIAAEKVEKADKLLKLELDMGFEKRTVVSGIAMHYKPEEIVGKQVTVVTNLAPRKMRGIESAGMILMAEDKDGKLVFVSPVDTTAPGSEVR